MTKPCSIPTQMYDGDAEELFAALLDALAVVLDDAAPPAERVQACGLWLDVAADALVDQSDAA